MTWCDFVVKYDPEKEKPDDLFKKIWYSVVIKRLKLDKKPCVMIVSGDSGEGKSSSILCLQRVHSEILGFNLREILDDINVYTPVQYPEKLDRLLHDKSLKKINLLALHEARNVIRSTLWQSFQAQAIADVNAMSRSIKRLCIFIATQFIKDITREVRYTGNFYLVIKRPRGHYARIYWNVLWKDDRDLEKPQLRKRKLSGYVVLPDGVYRRYAPAYFEVVPPDKDIYDLFDKQDTDAKSRIIKGKLSKLIDEMNRDAGSRFDKIDSMVEFYVSDAQRLNSVGSVVRGRWRVSKEFAVLHNLTPSEVKDFEGKLFKRVSSEEVHNDWFEGSKGI